MKKSIFSVLSAGLLLSLTTTSFAAVFQQEDSLIISVPVLDDLYAAGEKVSMQNTVNGDLTIAGGNLDVPGKVQGDLAAGGGTISITGEVVDDARIGGGNVRITGKIGDDLIVAGGTVVIEAGATIGGDVIIMGGDVSVFGTVGGGVRAYAGNITLAGTVQGRTEARGGNIRLQGNIRGDSLLIAENIVVTDTAQFGGHVRYWRTAGEMDIKNAAGTVTYDPTLKAKHENGKKAAGALGTLLGVFTIFSLLSGALLIGLLVLLLPNYWNEGAKYLRSEPGWALLYGALYLILTPIIALILMVTIIGLPIGFMVLILYIISLYLSCSITAILFANWIGLQYKKRWNQWIIFVIAVGISILMKLLGLIPIVGWIIDGVLVLMALGTCMQMKYRTWKKIA